jgi:signal transduction histidine kinase
MEKRMSDIGGSFEIKTSGLGTEVNYGFHL